MSEHPVIKVAKREVTIVHSRKPDAGEEPTVNLPAGHVVWLIEQAEQKQELEMKNYMLTVNRDDVENINEGLRKRIEESEEALRFYADEDGTWNGGEYEGGIFFSVAEIDKGRKAREALEGK